MRILCGHCPRLITLQDVDLDYLSIRSGAHHGCFARRVYSIGTENLVYFWGSWRSRTVATVWNIPLDSLDTLPAVRLVAHLMNGCATLTRAKLRFCMGKLITNLRHNICSRSVLHGDFPYRPTTTRRGTAGLARKRRRRTA